MTDQEARDKREALIAAADALTADQVYQHPFAALDKIHGLTRELRAEIARKSPAPEVTDQEARDGLSRALTGIVEDGIDQRDAIDAILAWMERNGYVKQATEATAEAEELLERLNRAFGSSSGASPRFTAEAEGDEYLFRRWPHPEH